MDFLKAEGFLVRVDGQNRVVIPAPVRRRLGVSDGTQVIMQCDGECITIRPYCPKGDLTVPLNMMQTQLDELQGTDDMPADKLGELLRLNDEIRKVLAT